MLTGESLTKIEDSEEDRRAGFVDKLLSEDGSSSNAVLDVPDSLVSDTFQRSNVQENKYLTVAEADPIGGSMSFPFVKKNK